MATRMLGRDNHFFKHGLSRTPEHRAWEKMIQRCENPAHNRFRRYGRRGIVVCPKWRHDFPAFLADVGPRPSPRHSLERLDNDGPYEPGNVVWATSREQNRNRGNNRLLAFGDRTMCLTAWAEQLGVKPGLITDRLNAGWPVEKALSTPARVWRHRGAKTA